MRLPVRFPLSWASGLLLGAAALAPAFAAGTRPSPDYEGAVLPLFQARCGACHGSGNPEAGLDVRTHGDLLQGGYSGSPVVPGSPEKSLLYQMLADGRMPKGKRFSAAELKLVADWIRAGARGKTGAGGHWAFRAPKQPPLPAVKDAKRVRTPLDRFLLAALEAKGLGFSPDADRRTLIRRVTYDLIGLPPAPEEVEKFIADPDPQAYEKLVDRLLADPRYGERWARHWLDPAGYADSEGVLQEDRIRPNAWRYRDYVIRALNADKPYDQFLREQIAGDELVDYKHAKQFTPEVVDTLAATGFLRTAVDATRDDFNSHQYGEYQYRMLHDTQTIVFSTVLGLTVQCSRCHNHKYEPLTQKDYYRAQSLFMGAVRPRGALLPTNRRQIIAGTAEEQENAKKVNAAVEAALGQLNQEQQNLIATYRVRHAEAKAETVPEADRAPFLAALKLPEASRSAEQKALVAKYPALAQAGPDQLSAAFPDFRDGMAGIQKRRQEENARRITLPEIRAFYDQDATPPPTPLLIRGEWLRPGDPVEPGIPAVLDDPARPFTVPAPAPGAYTTGRRRAFAEWLTRPDHPLTGRVLVNRIWAHHFGAGIVPTVENFGRSGQRPTNQALLDWMATAFTRPAPGGLGWSLKKLHRLIVTSTAYRQSSAADPKTALRNAPLEALLWRQRPRRLEAEAVRDGMLSVSGTLDPTMYGEPVGNDIRPTGEIVPSGEENGGRRSIYVLVRRSLPVTFLNSFDQPIIETNCTRRTASTTATQALALMNSSFVSSQAGHFARRLVKDAGAAAKERDWVERAYHLGLSRPPTSGELGETLNFLREQTDLYQKSGKNEAEARQSALSDFCQALLSSNEFVYVD